MLLLIIRLLKRLLVGSGRGAHSTPECEVPVTGCPVCQALFYNYLYINSYKIEHFYSIKVEIYKC